MLAGPSGALAVEALRGGGGLRRREPQRPQPPPPRTISKVSSLNFSTPFNRMSSTLNLRREKLRRTTRLLVLSSINFGTRESGGGGEGCSEATGD